MIEGILKKHRNLLFKEFEKSKLDSNYFEINYDVEHAIFEIRVKGRDFVFSISRVSGEIDYFSPIYADALSNDDTIKTSGDIDAAVYLLGEWLRDSAKDYIKIITEEEKEDDLWESIKDPLVKKYQEEFIIEFDIVDENADKEPFDLSQQLYLDAYLEGVINNIEAHKTELNGPEIQEIISDSKSLKENITKLTKKETVKRLATIWAKMRKSGLTLIKEFVQTAKQEIFKAIVKGLIE